MQTRSRKPAPNPTAPATPTQPTQPNIGPEPVIETRKRLPLWASLLIAINGIGLLGVSIAVTNPSLTNRVLRHSKVAPIIAKVFPNGLALPEPQASIVPAPAESPTAEPERQTLTYEQWLDTLKQEADAVAKKQPPNLTVLLGDSLSLWFPTDELPSNRTWLNQGISGDTTASLLKRLSFLDETKPQTLFIMAGVNDLKTGVSLEEMVANYRTLIQTLKAKHPQAELVIQSLLPRGNDENVTVEDREQVLAIANDQIVQFNQQLATLSQEEQVLFLNLHPLFADREGFLKAELSTDGLHLNPTGYMVWSSALQTFSQTQLRILDKPVTTSQEAAPEPAEQPKATPAAEAPAPEKPAEETPVAN